MSGKNDWKAEYKQIKKKISSFEADILKLFPFIQTTTLKNELIQLYNNEEKCEFDRSKEREDIFLTLSLIRKDIKSFKEKIKYFDKSEANVNKIQEITLSLETKMSDFQTKQMQIFDDLAQQEEKFCNDLDLFSNRLESYENNQIILENKQKKPKPFSTNFIKEQEENEEYSSFYSENDINEKKNKETDEENEENDNEIQEIDHEMEQMKAKITSIDKKIKSNGGVSCGWPDEDHKDFLKIRTKHKNNINRAVFFDDCVSAFPLYPPDDIKMHIESFKIYQNLENEKKRLVEEYKMLKTQKKRKILNIIDEENKIEEKNKENRNINTAENQEKQRKLKEQLQEWKRKKLSLKELQNEKKTQQELEKKKLEEQKLKEKKLEISEKLKEYKQNKEKEKQTKLQPAPKKTVDPSELERIKQKEEQILLKKKELLEKRKISEEEKKKKLEKMLETKNIKFSYVDSKLNEQTKAIQGKKNEKFDPRRDQPKLADTFGGVLGKGPSRAIPSWRQGV